MKRLQISTVLLVAVLSAGCGLLPFGKGGKLPVQESAAWTRVELGPDKAVDAPGLYLREMSSGKTEGWQVKGEAGVLRAATFPSDDLLVAQTDDKWYTINRTSGKVHEWDYTAVALVAASSGRLLFQELTTHGFHVTDADLKVERSFKAPDGVTAVVGAMSADGKTAAVVPASGGPVYLVDLGRGKLTEVADSPRAGVGPMVRTLPGGKAFVVGYRETQENAVLHRYAWDGTHVARIAVPGTDCTFTRDAKYVMCAGGTWPAQVEESDAETGEPMFRVLGANWGALNADGSQAVFGLDHKPEYRMLKGRDLVTTAVTKMGAAGNPPVPSPAALDTFALRGMVIDGEGKAIFTAPVDTAKWQFGEVAPWGKEGAEFRYLVREPMPTDYVYTAWPFGPVMQTPPYPAELWLEVKTTGGDCLNLRSGAGKSAKIIRCMPSGTRLQPVGAPGAEESRDGERWIQVKTEKGESGWVAITTGDIRYAER